jgi:predicted nucleotide-binding protein
MAEAMNPYNCSRPGNLFTGYERMRDHMIRGLRNGKSYAVLGGRRCGKTSFLLKLEEDLNQQAVETHRLLPRMLDMQAIVPRTPADFFRAIYGLAVQDMGAAPSDLVNYQDFLARLDQARAAIEQKHGPNWVIVLLIDEFDSAIARLPDSECLENFRNLLTNSRYKGHFRVVATGVFSPAELMAKGSPLNNLDPEYLGIIDAEHARRLIAAGFPDGLAAPAEALLLEHTGRHPYILQGMLEYLWDSGAPDETTIRLAGRRFVRDRAGTFRRWLEGFRAEGCALYRALLEGTHVAGLSTDDALAVLSYHGVIDESTPDSPRISGTLFREWFRANYQLEKDLPTAASASARTAALEPGAPSAAGNTRIFVVHGRNERIRVALFTFLRTLGLEPLDWTAVVEATGNPAPHINEILQTGFRIAHAAVVLMTPDDEARLRQEFRTPDDPPYESDLYPQPRPNVLFEAGMAMARFPNRTVLVQVGPSRPFSDIAGIHYIKMDNSLPKRRDLANRLKMAGCGIVDLNSTTEWHTAGDFTLPQIIPAGR